MNLIAYSVLASVCLLSSNGLNDPASKIDHASAVNKCSLAAQPGEHKMTAIEFKSQDYCRLEVPDFNFDAKFTLVSATVYFSGANFKGVETGYITSSSLKPVAALKARCIPGSIVVFDEVKVIGPDKELRVIPGKSFVLF